MNRQHFKVIFSKRRNAMVVVGETVAANGKSTGVTATRTHLSTAGSGVECTHPGGLAGSRLQRLIAGLVVWGASGSYAGGAHAALAAGALPGGGVVASGTASISTTGTTMGIVQSSDKASINWTSFNVGSAASVNIVQPGSGSVLLNRVVGSDPSQIMGSITANGQVMLVNPNGVVFGKGGSVTATAFTASTLGISDADFQAGNYRFTRNGSTAGVINQGTITTNGGYVALLGASVTNEGRIVTQGGDVVMAAGESATVSIPVSRTGRVRLLLKAADINTAVANTPGGIVQTEGGQVLMQAASLADVLAGTNATPQATPHTTSRATITQSGTIDTTGVQGGAVTLRADGGNITVDGKITANSTGAGTAADAASPAGGDIIIGRALDDNGHAVLAANTDVSGAILESRGGFVETSGHRLVTTSETDPGKEVKVLAKDWLLDPYDIEITNGALGTDYTTRVSATSISTALNNGTSVTIQTTAPVVTTTPTANAVTPGITGADTGTGNIKVTSIIAKTAGTDATLTLIADNGIDVNANIGASGTGTGKLNVALTAKGTSTTAVKGLTILSNATVDANGGSVALTGTGSGVVSGVSILGNVKGGTVQVTGTNNSVGLNSASVLGALVTGNVTADTGITMLGNGAGANIQGKLETTGLGANINITGNTANLSSAVEFKGAILKTNAGKTTVTGDSTYGSASTSSGVTVSGNTTWTGDLELTGTSTKNSGVIISTSLTGDSGKLKINGATLNNTVGASMIGTVTASGDIEITGSNNSSVDGSTGANPGLGISSLAVTSTNGSVTLRANSNAPAGGDVSVGLNTTKPVTISAAQAVNIYADTFNVNTNGSTIVAPAVNIASNTPGIEIKVNGPDSGSLDRTKRILGIEDTALNVIKTDILRIGNSTAGKISVSPDMTVNLVKYQRITTLSGSYAATAIDITSGSDIVLSGTLITNAATTALTLNAGGSVSGSGNLTWGNTTGGTITVNSANSGTSSTLSGVISGAVNLVKQGAGTTILTGTNSYSGTTTISAGTLQVGAGGASATTGTVGSGNIVNNAILVFSRADALTVAGDISGSGTVTQSGSGTTTVTGNNSYTGGTAISAGTLQVGDGGTGTLGTGAVVLSNNATLSYVRQAATSIGNSISGSGNVSANISGAVSGTNNALAIDQTINLTDGTVALAADGNLAINQNIATTNTGSSAILLVAGQSTAAGTNGGGDVSVATGKTLTTGTGARTTIMTGSIAGSTGVIGLVGSGSGNFRYNSSKSTTNYTTALGAGRYAIYREAPTLSATLNSASKTYDGQAWTGGNGVGSYTGFVIGDTNAMLGSITWGGTAQGSRNATDSTPYTISGTQASGLGYTVALGSGTLTVGKRALSLAAVTDSKTYDGTTASSAAVQVTGLQTGTAPGGVADSVTASQSFDSRNATALNGATLRLNSGYTINDGNGGNNYTVTVSAATATGTINKRALTLAAASDSKTYDGTTASSAAVQLIGLQTGTVAGGTADSVTGTSQSFTGRNATTAGGATLVVGSGYTVNDGNGGNNYTTTTATASGTINKRVLTLAAATDSKTYDGTTASSGTVQVSGLQTGTIAGGTADSISGTSQSYASRNATTTGGATLVVGSGYTISDGNGGNNYTVATTTASGTIDKRALTLAAVTDSKTYDGTTASSGVVQVSGLQTGTVAGGTADSIGGTSQSYASRNATAPGGATLNVDGGYTINDGNGGNNYSVTTTTASGTINKRALTLAAVTDSKTYDGTTASSANVQVSGLQTGTVAGGSADSVTASQSFDSRNATAVNGATLRLDSGYTVNDGNGGNNYTVTVSAATASGTINKRALTLAAASDSKTYDGTTASSANVQVSGLQTGTVAGGSADSVTASQSFDSRNATAVNGATLRLDSGYTVNDGNGGNNYTVTVSAATASGTINKRALTLAAASDSKTYDGTTASSAAVQAIGLQTGTVAGGSADSVSASQSFDSRNATATNGATLRLNSGYTVNDGNGGNNYTVTVSSATASGTINQRVLTLAAVTDSKTYDGTTASSGAVQVSGLQTGTVAGGTADSIGGTSQSYASRNATTPGGATLVVDSSYTINDGNGGNNYAVTTTTASGTINKRVLTLAAVTDSKTYDGTTASNGTVQVSGLQTGTVSGGMADSVTARQSFGSKNVLGADKSTLAVTGDYTVNDGNGGNNYSVSTTTAYGTITPKALTVSAVATNKVNDGTVFSPLDPAVDGLLSPDRVVKNATQTYDTSTVGTGKTLTPAGLEIDDGNGGANYTIRYLPNGDGIITGATDKANVIKALLPVSAESSRVRLAVVNLIGGTRVSESEVDGASPTDTRMSQNEDQPVLSSLQKPEEVPNSSCESGEGGGGCTPAASSGRRFPDTTQ